MAHHSSNHDEIMNEAFLEDAKDFMEKLREKDDELLKTLSNLGATHNFPDGKLTPHDDGEIKFAIGYYKGNVVINFNTPVVWLGMLPEQAKQLAELLLRYADGMLKK